MNGLGTEFHGQHKVNQYLCTASRERYELAIYHEFRTQITAYACTPGSYQLTGWVKDWGPATPLTLMAQLSQMAEFQSYNHFVDEIQSHLCAVTS